MAHQITSRWMTISELATYLKMGKTKLYGMAQNGEIPGCKIGNLWRFDVMDIDKWIKSHQKKNS